VAWCTLESSESVLDHYAGVAIRGRLWGRIGAVGAVNIHRVSDGGLSAGIDFWCRQTS
jgi:hypothetical protein